MSSVLGTILDPAADKALMTTLTITLTMQELIPGERPSSLSPRGVNLTHQRHTVPLAVIILGRDVLLSLSAFYIRYSTLPNPVGYQAFPTSSTLTFRPENLFAILGLLFTFSRSTANNYKQG